MNDERFNIPYIKLKFHYCAVEDTVMPEYKVSALRGGMGEMLLRENCISDRDCKNCPFEDPCIVRNTMYTKMRQKPAFMQGDDSVGYLIECEDSKTEYYEGDELIFYLILFGRNVVYFSQYLQAFYRLGMQGIGVNHSRFEIVLVENTGGLPIVTGNQVNMENYRLDNVSSYIKRRLNYIRKNGLQNQLHFKTLFSTKFRGEYVQEFYSESIIQAIFRRVMIMDYFTENYLDMPVLENYPEILFQKCKKDSVTRFSSTQEKKVTLRGIKGMLQFEQLDEELLPYIIAGELLHIGKNSSFGFGKYLLK